MTLMPNLKKIFQENLDAMATCPKCNMAGCKCNAPVAEATSVNMDLEKGADHEQKEHGLSFELARKLATDHIREHPGYYTKMAQCGLDEELSTDPAPAGTPNAPPTPGGTPNTSQGKDPSQVDPKVYAKYKAEADGMDKKIDAAVKDLANLRQSKTQLAQKYGINPNP